MFNSVVKFLKSAILGNIWIWQYQRYHEGWQAECSTHGVHFMRNYDRLTWYGRAVNQWRRYRGFRRVNKQGHVTYKAWGACITGTPSRRPESCLSKSHQPLSNSFSDRKIPQLLELIY